MRRLDDVYFPVPATRAEGMLPVSDGHSIHWEESGNPGGVPWIEAHGGPGGRANRFLRGLIDSERCRIIQFDQRGCGSDDRRKGLRGLVVPPKGHSLVV